MEPKTDANENSINVKTEEIENNKPEPLVPQIEDNEDLSALSFTSYDSIDNIKIDKMGQYTCDQCCEIPKIINTDINKRTILFKCKNHGQKEMDIKNYVFNALNFNSKNWKCSECNNVQRDKKEYFKYCQCGNVFCEQCYKVHQEKQGHTLSIDSNNFDLKCKKDPSHFGESYIGYCFECHDHYCTKCQEEHDLHTVTKINEMVKDKNEVENIRKLNKEYRSLITYYESLIRLNNLIIYSYENYRDNYYNLYNINTIINNYKRNEIINPLNDIDNKIIIAGEKNANLYKYMNDLYHEQLKEEETDRIEIDNKYFNNYDFKVLTQIPLKNLHLLVLENNSISKIDCLANADFPDLVILNLNNNAIDDVSVLENIKFVEIQALLFRNNNIKNIEVFGKIKYDVLREIDLRDNKIDDIGVFENHKLEMLQCLYLSGNEFKDINKFPGAKARIDKLIEFEY